MTNDQCKSNHTGFNRHKPLTYAQNFFKIPVALLFKLLFISTKKIRINERIWAPKVRLIDEKGNQVGVISREEALRMAKDRGFDLAEVSPNSDPPVCKLLDFGKYLYHQKKVEQKHRKMQKKAEIKGVRLSLRTDSHDLETKAQQAKKFLGEGSSLKVVLIFKGREASHSDLAREKMEKFYEFLQEIAKMEQAPKRQGNTMMMILLPNK